MGVCNGAQVRKSMSSLGVGHSCAADCSVVGERGRGVAEENPMHLLYRLEEVGSVD